MNFWLQPEPFCNRTELVLFFQLPCWLCFIMKYYQYSINLKSPFMRRFGCLPSSSQVVFSTFEVPPSSGALTCCYAGPFDIAMMARAKVWLCGHRWTEKPLGGRWRQREGFLPRAMGFAMKDERSHEDKWIFKDQYVFDVFEFLDDQKSIRYSYHSTDNCQQVGKNICWLSGW